MLSALHTDLYQLNMGQVYFKKGLHEKKAVFEVYFRKNPFNGGYAVFCGLEKVIEYIKEFKFTKEEINYLQQTCNYDQEYLDYLSNIKFTGNIYAFEEGDIIFANEPILIVEANLLEAQIIETAILNIINFQTLIATKASKIKELVKKDEVFEFGARRAHDTQAALWGARACYIGGFQATSLVSAGMKFNIPIAGTHAHSFVQVYQNEYEAFKAYAEVHKDCTFLVDTYNVLQSGIPNAIKVAKEKKINFKAIRLDSGDLAYLSKEARKLLDEAGFENTKIIVSNDLDEQVITSLLMQNAKIDMWGIGTKVITAFDQPALGAVYKLVAIQDEDKMRDVIKISANLEKITTPSKKNIYRILNKETNKYEGDLITLDTEIIKNGNITLTSELNPMLQKVIKNAIAVKKLFKIFENGTNIYEANTKKAKIKLEEELKYFYDGHKRYVNPAEYYVDLSNKCRENKMKLIKER